MTKLYVVSILLALPMAVFAQGKVSGKLVDADTKEPLIGAAIFLESDNGVGTITSLDGTFALNLENGAYTLVLSYLGYVEQTKAIRVDGDLKLGTIKLESSSVGLNEVAVIASVAVDRKTPVALSTLSPQVIEEKLGTQEFPEILKSTPSVYATKDGGGFGDGRINVRGFDSPNVAVMINGIPVNGMENGRVYWSNWAGLADVTRSMQVQRGLGASKVAVPSIGGSINILTKTTDATKGGSIATSVGNDGYKKVSFNVSTGLNEKGWAMTLLGAKTTGDGYIQGTEFEGYSYFLNVAKRINDNHQLSFTAFGAKQWHYQRSRFDKLSIMDWETKKDKYKYNGTYGFGVNGVRKSSAKNFYHKPQFSLNHYWNINEKSSWSTSLYGSVGNGGGHSARGDNRSWLYGTDDTYRTLDGYKDYAAIQKVNAENPDGATSIISISNNSHRWAGAISTYNTRVNSIDFYGGIDFRYYEGDHNNEIEDLLGGAFFIDPYRARVAHKKNDLSFTQKELLHGDKIYRDYVGHVMWSGTFAQAEYNKGRLAAFLSGALSNTTYWRVDNMYYAENEKKSDKIDFIGFSVKGGANYNLTDIHNVFANIGYFSRAPIFDDVFLSSNNSNSMNDGAENEKIFSTEVGYGLRTAQVHANLNLYRTEWRDKSFTDAIDSQDPDLGRVNAQGVNALHQGIELDLKYKPTKNLEITAMGSYGDWQWVDDVEAFMMDRDGNLVNRDKEIVTDPNEAEKVLLNIGDVHIGDAAQTTAALGVNYNFLDGFKVGIDYNYYDRLFADYGNIDDLEGEDTWQVPSANVFDANASYRFKFGSFDASLFGKVSNLFDAVYITDAESGSNDTWKDAYVFYGFGRTWSVSLKLNF
ncbi:Outer membrane receptor proteins, mostly Fe transport [Saccharicrinis carchari]|uniref:Outer membrane receptor proteins, mostly Fe transport n=2 Tax=Saccharicrinis carchari TaxID=1168039 RepID=A0A521BBS5_SACCC|nr:Outer membrane receptor proteins, mostly Fe transport [Saccharicrinis carchari]